MRASIPIRATSSLVFSLCRSLERRNEWDDLWHTGEKIEILDYDVEVLYMCWRATEKLGGNRDYCVLSVGRERETAKMVIYKSVFHSKCPAKKGYVRGEMEIAFVVRDVSPHECQLIAFMQVCFV